MLFRSQNAESAKKLRYRKDDSENDGLEGYFDLFIANVQEKEKATWNAESGEKLWTDLGNSCTACHEKYRD